jgi:hypothetical protein
MTVGEKPERMMLVADETSVDLHAARAAIQKIVDSLDDLSSGFDKLHSTLEDRSGCWGEDETGKKFAEKYLPGYDKYMEQFGQFRDKLKTAADDAFKVPQQLAEQDAENARRVASGDE